MRNLRQSKESPRFRILLWSALGALLLAVSGSATAAAQDEGCDLAMSGICTRTSAVALRACRNDSREEYWLGVANCINQSEDRRDCLDELKDDRSELREECVEVCDARQDVCERLGPDRYDPEIDPADFLSPAEIAATPNPYFPLVPGTVFEYEEGEDVTVTVTVTEETIEILGVTCIEVRDVEREDGEILEDTADWYAQDSDGNVWYFGEISQEFEDGRLVDIEGSWKAGQEGATPGILMLATPQVGDFYRQEFFLDDAEDVAGVIAVDGDESVPAASCGGACVVTEDLTALEPGALENKYYLAGVGLILEIGLEDDERLELVSVTGP